jgi:hypothetical protein
MNRSLRPFALPPLAAVVVLLGAGEAQAQYAAPRINARRVVVVPVQPAYYPNYVLPNGVPVSQYTANVAALGQAYSQVPPYLLGYNPYPTPVINYYGVHPAWYAYSWPPFTGLGATNYPLMPGLAGPNFYTNPFFSFLNNNP